MSQLIINICMFHSRNILRHFSRAFVPYNKPHFIAVPLLNQHNKFFFSNSQNNENENNENDDKDKNKKDK